MVTPASPLFACMQLNDKRSCWRFEKNLRSVEKGVVLAIWSCASRHPRALQWSCIQFLSWCLVCWAGSERFACAWFSCDLDGSVVLTYIFRSERTLPSWGSLEVCQRPAKLEKQRRKQHYLRFWRFVRILPDDFCLRQLLANFSVCHELLGLFFVISEAKTFRQGKVVISKSASFSDKRRFGRNAFFSILYSWQWSHKGLTIQIDVEVVTSGQVESSGFIERLIKKRLLKNN